MTTPVSPAVAGRVEDADQLVFAAVEYQRELADRPVSIHAAALSISKASRLARSSVGASSISVVCQKAGPLTTPASTRQPDARHVSMRFDDAGPSDAPSRVDSSSQRKCFAAGNGDNSTPSSSCANDAETR
jgi:hypothetical protein